VTVVHAPVDDIPGNVHPSLVTAEQQDPPTLQFLVAGFLFIALHHLFRQDSSVTVHFQPNHRDTNGKNQEPSNPPPRSGEWKTIHAAPHGPPGRYASPWQPKSVCDTMAKPTSPARKPSAGARPGR
jgi:hypothetical protein